MRDAFLEMDPVFLEDSRSLEILGRFLPRDKKVKIPNKGEVEYTESAVIRPRHYSCCTNAFAIFQCSQTVPLTVSFASTVATLLAHTTCHTATAYQCHNLFLLCDQSCCLYRIWKLYFTPN